MDLSFRDVQMSALVGATREIDAALCGVAEFESLRRELGQKGVTSNFSLSSVLRDHETRLRKEIGRVPGGAGEFSRESLDISDVFDSSVLTIKIHRHMTPLRVLRSKDEGEGPRAA